MHENGPWFEDAILDGKLTRHVSKFLKPSFGISPASLKSNWFNWTQGEKLKFAAAFSARGELYGDDVDVLDFLMESGSPEIWTTLALLVSKHPNKDRAREFLLDRVNARIKPLANYYQALETLPHANTELALRESLKLDQAELETVPVLSVWSDRFIYLDYLSCCAALFRITEDERYRDILRGFLSHPEIEIRNMVTMVAQTGLITLS
jgi:hypothetical protein